ncbi:MAG: type II toxin-antitoxin system death-on-curing family toxin [Gemmatimonadales bacterium]
MRYLSLGEVLELHRRIIATTGGASELRDLGALESAVAQPRMTFGGEDLYADLASKAAALGYSIIQNHPFVDGNKRVGHAALETFLVLNGSELDAPVTEAEQVILEVAAGTRDRDGFLEWVRRRLRATSG